MKYVPLSILSALLIIQLTNLLLKGILLAKIITAICGLYIFSMFAFFCFSACGIALGFLGMAIYNIFKLPRVNALM